MDEQLYYLVNAKTGETERELWLQPEKAKPPEIQAPRGYCVFINTKKLEECQNLNPRVISDFIYLTSLCNLDNVISNKLTKRHLSIGKVKELINDPHGRKINQLIKNGFLVCARERVIIPKDVMLYGNVAKNISLDSYIRVYQEYIRTFYESATKKQKRNLGNLYKLAPYLNFKWNVVCSTPTYTQLEDIEPYYAQELVQLMGYSKNNYQLIIDKIKDLEFISGSTKYRLVVHGLRGRNFCGGFFINPYFMYRGKDIEEALNIKVKSTRGGEYGYKFSRNENKDI